MDASKKRKLFLGNTYEDSIKIFNESLSRNSDNYWDFVILTASNDEQVKSYEVQIEYRKKHNILPSKTKYLIIPDPNGKRVGSGGATLNVIKYIKENYTDINFSNTKILLIHSGGDSKRAPQYSVTGKLFSPVPREIFDGRKSTLFDEFMISLSLIPSRISSGMLVISGDVLLLFNPLQVDFQYKNAAALSIKMPVEAGKNHGVFVSSENNEVTKFLHKCSVDKLIKENAVENNNVNLDTGAIFLSDNILNKMCTLVSTDNKIDIKKFNKFVNEKVRLNFYGDFLYPMSTSATLDEYLKTKPENIFCDELIDCRKLIWQCLNTYNLNIIKLSPADFVHFGTTYELKKLMCEEINNYEFLNWNNYVSSYSSNSLNSTLINSLVLSNKNYEECYFEDSLIKENANIGRNCIISNSTIENVCIPDDICLHTIILKNGNYVTRIYGIKDNPKDIYSSELKFLNANFNDFLKKYNIDKKQILSEDSSLWNMRLFSECKSMNESIKSALNLYNILHLKANDNAVKSWLNSNRYSFYASFDEANIDALIKWQNELSNNIIVNKIIYLLKKHTNFDNIIKLLTNALDVNRCINLLKKELKKQSDEIKYRGYYLLSTFYKKINKKEAFRYEELTFDEIKKSLKYDYNLNNIIKICKDEVKIELPIRINFAGGWSDTPPYCIENGGTVLNAAVLLNGNYPIKVRIKKLKKKEIILSSIDCNQEIKINDIKEIQKCNNPSDPFSLHKCALIVSQIIPLSTDDSLNDILENIGGGILIETFVEDIPKGSGLGTSSILASACLKALFDFIGVTKSDCDLSQSVMQLEQLLSTGGGWQDQVGGLIPGLKLITTHKGKEQNLKIDLLNLSPKIKDEFNSRLLLIYTGQRRLAKNILRDIVGKYISGNEEIKNILEEIQRISILMKFELEKENFDNFCSLLNKHWTLSKQLDKGCSNVCIEQIFDSVENLIDAKFICGAGGGGYTLIILKKGVSKKQLEEKLYSFFYDSGVKVYDATIIYGNEVNKK